MGGFFSLDGSIEKNFWFGSGDERTYVYIVEDSCPCVNILHYSNNGAVLLAAAHGLPLIGTWAGYGIVRPKRPLKVFATFWYWQIGLIFAVCYILLPWKLFNFWVISWYWLFDGVYSRVALYLVVLFPVKQMSIVYNYGLRQWTLVYSAMFLVVISTRVRLSSDTL